MSRRIRTLVILIFAFILGCMASSLAQTTSGMLTGTVSEAKGLSTVSNTVGYHLDATYIERQPLPREPAELMDYAPGVQDGRAYGAPSEALNAYNLDGVDVSDPALGTQWVFPSIDWIQEVQVTGLGADAQYGGFTAPAPSIPSGAPARRLATDTTRSATGRATWRSSPGRPTPRTTWSSSPTTTPSTKTTAAPESSPWRAPPSGRTRRVGRTT